MPFHFQIEVILKQWGVSVEDKRQVYKLLADVLPSQDAQGFRINFLKTFNGSPATELATVKVNHSMYYGFDGHAAVLVGEPFSIFDYAPLHTLQHFPYRTKRAKQLRAHSKRRWPEAAAVYSVGLMRAIRGLFEA